MTIPVLLTKVIPPHRRDDILTRQRLVDSLDTVIDQKLVVIAAPAGYGKTSLLVDYARQSKMPICWYSLDETDLDLQRFLTHFIASIEQRYPVFGEQSKAALMAVSSGELAIEHFVITIVNELYNCIQEHFVIVLDDFHLVNPSEAISDFLNRFIQDVDQNCHLVLLTRALISLPDLPLLVARSEAGGFGFLELAFQADEIKALMLQNYQQVIPQSVADDLEKKTEGWITGLLLSAHTIWEGMVDRMSLMRDSGAGLYDYLIHQVLDQQPEEMRQFLLRTSFLEEFNIEMCEALLGPAPQGHSWQASINRVLQNNLFAIPVGEYREWLRYHQLFRDFLQNQFELERPQELDGLLRTLVEIYSSREEWERAYALCLRLGDIDFTVAFLENAGEPMVRSGRIELLREWLETLPRSVVDGHPALLARLGIILATQGNTARGLQLLDQAVSYFRANHILTRLAGTLVWRALVYHFILDSDRSMADANETLSLTEKVRNEPSMIRFRAEACKILGQNYRMLGNLDMAIQNLTRALDIYQAQADEQGANLIRLSLGAVYLDAGDLAAALSSYKMARDFYQSQGNLIYLAAVLNDIGFVQHLRGEFKEAFDTYEEALEKVHVGGIARVQMLILVGIGDLYADLDAPESASEAYTKARSLLGGVGDHFLTIYLTLAEAGMARITGDWQRARLLLANASQDAKARPSNYTNGLILIESGRQASAQGNHKEAIARLAEAAIIFEDSGQLVLAGRTNLTLASNFYKIGDLDAAATRLNKAFELVSGLEGENILLPAARQAKEFLASTNSSAQGGHSAGLLYEQVLKFDDRLADLKHSLRYRKMTIPLAPPQLRIQVFGETKVTLNGKLVLRGNRQNQDARSFLFFLLSKPRGVSREGIALLLWPESESSQLRNQIKNAAYRLRRVLQQDAIRFEGKMYHFNRDMDYEYDVERFEELSDKARIVNSEEERQKLYKEIVQIYCGEYLPEESGAWVHSERERLRQIFISAGLQLSTVYLEACEHEMALDVCNRLIDEDACLEQAYCIAMQAYAANGNKTALVNQYETLKLSLKHELGMTPSAQTELLYSSLI